MNAVLNKVTPSITTMIRLDHKHVQAIFHRYPAAPPGKKAALAANACLALEIHAQLEEEIFYPAMRNVASESELLDKSFAEHEQVRRLIETLRTMRAGEPVFDDTFLQLAREVMHHVADEETRLLPLAEKRLRGRLGELGMEMTRRRIELLKPHAGEALTTTARSFPAASLLLGAGALALGALIFRNPRGRKAAMGAMAMMARNQGARALHRMRGTPRS